MPDSGRREAPEAYLPPPDDADNRAPL